MRLLNSIFTVAALIISTIALMLVLRIDSQIDRRIDLAIATREKELTKDIGPKVNSVREQIGLKQIDISDYSSLGRAMFDTFSNLFGKVPREGK